MGGWRQVRGKAETRGERWEVKKWRGSEGRREESGLDCGPGGLCLGLRTEKLLKIERSREMLDVCVDVL